MLAAHESMLSAVVADGMTGDRHNPNVEPVAQGIANTTYLASAFLSSACVLLMNAATRSCNCFRLSSRT